MSTPYHKAITAMYCAQRAYKANLDKNHPDTIAAAKQFFLLISDLPFDVEAGLFLWLLYRGVNFSVSHPELGDLWDAFSERVKANNFQFTPDDLKLAQFHIDLYHLQDFTERYGKDAATMFKLSEGNIDPRGEQ